MMMIIIFIIIIIIIKPPVLPEGHKILPIWKKFENRNIFVTAHLDRISLVTAAGELGRVMVSNAALTAYCTATPRGASGLRTELRSGDW